MKKLIFASAAGILLLFSASTSNVSYGTAINSSSEYFGSGCRIYEGGEVVLSCQKCNCAKLYKTYKQLQ